MKKKLLALLLSSALMSVILTPCAVASPADGAAMGGIAPDSVFKIEQSTGAVFRRPIQALYTTDGGSTVKYSLREMPKLNIPGAPNGGGALSTFKFKAIADDGTEYTSFCADIGATGIKGSYYIDEANRGLSDAQLHDLAAAIDFIYDTYGCDDYESYALSQLIVWNMVLMYAEGPSLADNWVRSTGVLYTDAFGELFKIEGYNNTNGSNPWYTAEYKALVDDILKDPGKYSDIYDAKIAEQEDGPYVSGVVFLVGDGRYSAFNQQSQLVPIISDLSELNGGSGDDDVFCKVNIHKMVLDGGETSLIVDWMIDNVDLGLIFVLMGDEEGTEDIVFELYDSDEYGAMGALANSGRVGFDSMITFDLGIRPGWYLVHEVMGPIASSIFRNTDDVLVHFYRGDAHEDDGYEWGITFGGSTEDVEPFVNVPINS